MNRNELLNKIYKIAITTISIVLGMLMILFVFIIYFGGKEIIENGNISYQIYNVDILKKYLGYLLIPFVLWILTIIGGIFISYYYPVKEKKSYKLNDIEVYKLLKNKIPAEHDEYVNELKIINNERQFRKIVFIIFSTLSLLAMIFPARYLFDFSNFNQTGATAINDAIKMSLNIFPWIIGSFILFGGYIYLQHESIKKELKEIRTIIKTYKGSSEVKIKKDNINKYINYVRACVVVLSIVFIVIGIFNGGVNNVLAKAVKICTECIGLA